MTAEITLRDAYEIKELLRSQILAEGGQACHMGGHVERSAREACSAKGVGSWERLRSPGQVPSLGSEWRIQAKGLRGFDGCLWMSLDRRGVQEEVVAGSHLITLSTGRQSQDIGSPFLGMPKHEENRTFSKFIIRTH